MTPPTIEEAAALLYLLDKTVMMAHHRKAVVSWLDRYEEANAAGQYSGRPVGQDPRECGKKCGPAGAGGTYPVCGRPPEHRGDCALPTSYANTWASACDWFEAAANAKDDGPLMSLVGAARDIAPGRHVLPEVATLDVTDTARELEEDLADADSTMNAEDAAMLARIQEAVLGQRDEQASLNDPDKAAGSPEGKP